MKIRPIAKKVGRFLSDHAETILTGIGIIGVTTTAIFAAKDSVNAHSAIDEEQEFNTEPLTFWQKLDVSAPKYARTAISWLITCGCIAASNIISEKKKSSLMIAYTGIVALLEKYKNHLTEEELIRVENDILNESYESHPIEDLRGVDEVMFYDELSDRFFYSTMQDVHHAVEFLNDCMAWEGFAWVNNFYEALDLKSTEEGDWLGWSLSSGEFIYGYSYIDVNFTPMRLDNGEECYYISFPFAPSDILQEEEQLIPEYPSEA